MPAVPEKAVSSSSSRTSQGRGGTSSSRDAEHGGRSRSLQDRLYKLLTRLSETTDILKNWPESGGDDASVHVETTTKLIASLHGIVKAVKSVEEKTTKGDGSDRDAELIRKLREYQVPLDLLDLMDYGNGLNPECFARGLLREALRQLNVLRRRKRVLEKLGSAIQAGLAEREKAKSEMKKNENRSAKRGREEVEGDRSGEDISGSIEEPPAKRLGM